MSLDKRNLGLVEVFELYRIAIYADSNYGGFNV